MFEERDITILTNIIKAVKISPNAVWAIYGTGNGAEMIYGILCKLSIDNTVKYVIERDEKASISLQFHGIPVKKLGDVADSLDGILIAAMDNHNIIWERVQRNLTESQLERINVIDIFGCREKEYASEYVKYIETSALRESPEFVKFNTKGYIRSEKDTKIIAWYLPQFHQMDINNKFHGQGFTEWTNTSRTIPMFAGHYQPHIPYDVGYYDLLNPATLNRQIYLAKHYGIYGFCFHYYWFSGKRIMEKPLEMFLQHREMDMPFCLDWATENWTALWDGGEKGVMIEQNLTDEDDQRFMNDILPYFRDSRYIKIDGKPVLVIYKIKMFEKSRAKILLSNFRKLAKMAGFPDLYIMLTNVFHFEDDVREWGADALVEFPPHGVWDLADTYNLPGYVNPHYKGIIHDASAFIDNKAYMLEHGEQTYYRSALTTWDNTARKGTSGGTIFWGLSPETFKRWLSDIVGESKKIHPAEQDIVFVNSWNEWAEGSHLEPDMKFGYAFLQMVKEVLEKYSNI